MSTMTNNHTIPLITATTAAALYMIHQARQQTIINNIRNFKVEGRVDGRSRDDDINSIQIEMIFTIYSSTMGAAGQQV